jgi:DNA-binding transcriptional LysR family regulator
MNLAAVDLNLLVALDALISEAHVGRAARKIGLSQPAVSHALSRLRALFGDPLLVRAGSRMELTPRAAVLRESLPDALRRIETLFAPEAFDPARSSRRFALMMHDHIAHLIAPALVKRIHTEAPAVTIDVLAWRRPDAMRPEGLRSLDLLISCATGEIAGFQRQHLFTDTEVTVVRKGHPSLAALRRRKAFLSARHVAVAGMGSAEDPVDAWLREEQMERTIALRVPSYVQALQAVAQSDLVAFVPRRLAESLARPLSLALVRPPLDPGTYDENLLYPQRAERDPASLWLRALVLEIGAQM